MKEQLERVIRKIILPHYSEIDDIDIELMEWEVGYQTYVLTYILPDDTYGYRERKTIGKETFELWDLLSPNNKDTLTLFFKDFDQWKKSQ